MRMYLMVFMVGICFVLIIFSLMTNTISTKRKWMLSGMAFTATVILIADRLASFYDGKPGFLAMATIHVSKFLVYGLYYLILWIYSCYIKDLLFVEGGVKKTPKQLLMAECSLLFGIIMLEVSENVGIYYYYDVNNVYHRQPGYFLAFLPPIITVIMQITTLVKNRQYIREKLFKPLILFTAMPIFAGLAQFVIHGASVTSITIVAMVVLLYCFSIQDTNELIDLAHKKEVELLLEKQRDFNKMTSQITNALVEAIDAKDSYTRGHSKRVADYSRMIAEKAGKSKEECDKIHLVGLLHDIGKIGIPDTIINKDGRLTDAEYEKIKKHPITGREILGKISLSPDLKIGAGFHHERWDGNGYPFGLRGEEIPEIARIIAVADSYDAMASKRSYRDILPKEVIRSELVKGSGTQFDPKFAQIMIELIDSDIDFKMKES